MTLHRKTIQAALLFGLGLSVSGAMAGNIAAGKEKATAICAACHGADGITAIDPSYPKLAGQYPDYLTRALSDYKSGARKNAIMAGMAAALSKEDIANIAAYYASLPSPLNNKK
ncbi:MAG: cytochrome c [Burkholderiaceae bacterium]|nr:cytochrome c [Burkholderiaceae bacterium]